MSDTSSRPVLSPGDMICLDRSHRRRRQTIDPDQLRHLVVISSSSSRCANCGENALPSQGSHISAPSWSGEGDQTGCGTEWHYSATDKISPSLEHAVQTEFSTYRYLGIVGGPIMPGYVEIELYDPAN